MPLELAKFSHRHSRDILMKNFLVTDNVRCAMNIPTVTLDEIEMDSEHAFGGLKCLIHTILFIRAPQHVPQTLGVEPKLAHFTYAKCGPPLQQTIEEAIGAFIPRVILTECGPGISRAMINLSLYKNVEGTKALLLNTRRKRYYLERWLIPLVVSTHLVLLTNKDGDGLASAKEAYLRIARSTRASLRARIDAIFHHARTHETRKITTFVESQEDGTEANMHSKDDAENIEFEILQEDLCEDHSQSPFTIINKLISRSVFSINLQPPG